MICEPEPARSRREAPKDNQGLPCVLPSALPRVALPVDDAAAHQHELRKDLPERVRVDGGRARRGRGCSRGRRLRGQLGGREADEARTSDGALRDRAQKGCVGRKQGKGRTA